MILIRWTILYSYSFHGATISPTGATTRRVLTENIITGGKKTPSLLSSHVPPPLQLDIRRRQQTLRYSILPKRTIAFRSLYKSHRTSTIPVMASSKGTITTLLLVDIQNDFHPGGSLAIPTANEDSHRVAQLIQQHSAQITRVVATMDSHVKLHIAHPGFWVDGNDDTTGRHPDPFTVIESKDIVAGKWKPRDDLKILPGTLEEGVFGALDGYITTTGADDGSLDLRKYAIEYTKRLEERGKFKLIIWPEHCLIGTKGFCMVDEVHQALQNWSMATGGTIEWVLKGENLLTESYSALEAEVPVNGETSFNQSLLESLKKTDKLLVCGQAMSHCVNYTLSNIVEHWDKDKLAQITLLTDCASSVPGFEAAGAQFQEVMSKRGVQLKTAAEAFD